MPRLARPIEVVIHGPHHVDLVRGAKRLRLDSFVEAEDATEFAREVAEALGKAKSRGSIYSTLPIRDDRYHGERTDPVEHLTADGLPITVPSS